MTNNLNIGFFFGAGADASYGLPLGGRFALDIFKQDTSQDKGEFKKLLDGINQGSPYACNWLPPQYADKRIHAFGKAQFSSIIESTLESKRSLIIDFFENFDSHAETCLKNGPVDRDRFDASFQEKTKEKPGATLYSQLVQVNTTLNTNTKLFGTKYFSALLKFLACDRSNQKLRQYLTAFIQLFIGAHGKNHINELNQQIFTKVPQNLPIFDDISGVFTLDMTQVGAFALELILATPTSSLDDKSTSSDVLSEFARHLLEELLITSLDYQSLIDSYFRYLYNPKDDWAKFTRISIFLFTVRRYINNFIEKLNKEGLESKTGYYHDLQEAGLYGINIKAIGTSNYNSLITRILNESDTDKNDVILQHLNGSLNDFYDPYLNLVKSYDSLEELSKDPHILVPFMLTQSGIKPLTSISMSRRYVNLFDSYLESDAIVTVGYRFNGDDGHINGMIRSLVNEHNKKLVIFHYTHSTNPSSLQQAKVDYCRRIRLEDDSNVHVLPINGDRKSGDLDWLNAAKNLLNESNTSAAAE
ncbi:hypothetical protein [Bradymonas sediminis]|uniref:hypothetical protein n=1 Tax=Bradymonas sediminis TaxID=1548548 RepID=UPI00105CA59A|nr:hypothetical protein [Bradymonas sediminis]TDP77712.1 hypothetical protein DFR33_101623 [Bradymonas sediminis]